MFTGPNIITDGLVLYLDAANQKSYPGSGTTWNDLSGNGNNGTLVNGPTFSNEGNGIIGFDGTNQYVNITNDLEGRQKWSSYWDNSNKLTILCLVKLKQEGFTGGRFGIIGNRYYSDTGYFNLHLHSNGSTQYILAYNNGYNANFKTLTSLFDRRNEWLFISLTHNGDLTTNALRYGINGIFGNTSMGSSVTVGDFMSGEAYNVVISKEQNYHNMDLSHISVYSRVLSDEEVLQNYNATKSRFNL